MGPFFWVCLVLCSPPLFTQLHPIPPPLAQQPIRRCCLLLLLGAAALQCCSSVLSPGPVWLGSPVGQK